MADDRYDRYLTEQPASRTRFYRDKRHGKVNGICAGIAGYQVRHNSASKSADHFNFYSPRIRHQRTTRRPADDPQTIAAVFGQEA